MQQYGCRSYILKTLFYATIRFSFHSTHSLKAYVIITTKSIYSAIRMEWCWLCIKFSCWGMWQLCQWRLTFVTVFPLSAPLQPLPSPSTQSPPSSLSTPLHMLGNLESGDTGDGTLIVMPGDSRGLSGMVKPAVRSLPRCTFVIACVLFVARLSLLNASPTVSFPLPWWAGKTGSLLDWGIAVVAEEKFHRFECKRSISSLLKSNWVRPK